MIVESTGGKIVARIGTEPQFDRALVNGSPRPAREDVFGGTDEGGDTRGNGVDGSPQLAPKATGPVETRALLDAVIVIVLALAGVIGRVLLHRPWEIEVSGPDQIVSWQVVGWRRSGQAIEQATTRLRSGRSVPTDVRDLRLD